MLYVEDIDIADIDIADIDYDRGYLILKAIDRPILP